MDTIRAAVGDGPLDASLAESFAAVEPVGDEAAADARLVRERDRYRTRFEAAAR